MKHSPFRLTFLLTALASGLVQAQEAKPIEGYKDSPILPGTPWHVHDPDRPQPKVVTPGQTAADAPSDAKIIFNGTDLSRFKPHKDGEPAWKIEDGVLVSVTGRGDIQTQEAFGPDFQLHVEWASPNPPEGTGQHRGNSGVFLFGLYEIQVLDCFENQTYPDGQTAAVYGQTPPLANACRKPGEWQTYDIIFNAPRFEGNTLKQPGYVTVIHNGVVVQNHVELMGAAAHRQLAEYKPHGEKGPIKLQDHGQQVRFRNIWLREF